MDHHIDMHSRHHLNCGAGCIPAMTRRRLGGIFAGLLASQALPSRAIAADHVAGVQRIDVHHHILPPVFRKTMGEAAIGAPAPNRAAPMWQVADSLAAMDRQGVTTAVVSAPPLWTKDMAQTRRLARACNEFGAEMMADHPTRFGTFACLPLPDVQAALEEISHSLDVLKADGVGLMTNYNDRYLGDAAFAPVFDELHRRKAVVFVHPTSCACYQGLMPDLPDSFIEFPHDTTRSVTSLLFSGTFSRCPDIRFIFSHAGGTVPFLANRLAILTPQDSTLAQRVPEGVLPVLKRQYYDTALSANPVSMSALLKFATSRNVLLGTDFPFVPERGMDATLEGIRQAGLGQAEIRAIEGENAAGIFARIAVQGARIGG